MTVCAFSSSRKIFCHARQVDCCNCCQFSLTVDRRQFITLSVRTMRVTQRVAWVRLRQMKLVGYTVQCKKMWKCTYVGGQRFPERLWRHELIAFARSPIRTLLKVHALIFTGILSAPRPYVPYHVTCRYTVQRNDVFLPRDLMLARYWLPVVVAVVVFFLYCVLE